MIYKLCLLASIPALSYGAKLKEQQFPSPDSRIVGGVDTASGEFPWLVSLQTNSGSHFCGGSLVAPNWVLTAAHCGWADQVRIGLWRRSQPNAAGVETIQVKTRYEHPSYNSNTYENDMALMELESSSTIAPAEPYFGEGNLETPGTSLTIAGWGTTSSGGYSSDTMKKAEVPVSSDAQCSAGYGNGYDSFSMICAGFDSGGVDACQGDSGGPMFSGTDVVGVVSWGYGCAFAGYPGVYARVSSYETWLCGIAPSACGTRSPTSQTASPTTTPPTPQTSSPTCALCTRKAGGESCRKGYECCSGSCSGGKRKVCGAYVDPCGVGGGPTPAPVDPTPAPDTGSGSCSDCSSIYGGGVCKSCPNCRWRKGVCQPR